MIYAFLAYLFWGFFPIYWKLLKEVSVYEILSHRVLWAFVFYTVIIYFKNEKLIFYKPKNKKSVLLLLFASIFLMSNWLLYIYAVNSNQIIESSLGYFINPLVNIFFGVFLLKEKLNRHQILASILAFIGVSIISFDQGHLPLIALTLAITFSLYGLLKKINSQSSQASGLESNQFESMLFAPMALIFILIPFFSKGSLEIQTHSFATWILLVGSGVVTGLPLIFFAEAARRIPYYLMGFFQFLAPTFQFACGVMIFNETLSSLKLFGFSIIWLGMFYLLFTSYLKSRNKKNQFIN